MNVKLTEQEYQHMIIDLVSESIQNIEHLQQNAGEDQTDWLYFIERLKTKGILSDLRPALMNVKDKSRHVSRTIRRQFDSDREKNITTMV